MVQDYVPRLLRKMHVKVNYLTNLLYKIANATLK